MDTAEILLWLKVRLSIGLGVSDKVLHAFFEAHGEQEATYWKELAGERRSHVTVYYLTQDYESAIPLHRYDHEDKSDLHNTKGNADLSFMVFHPSLAGMPNEEELELEGVQTPVAQRMDRMFEWAVMVSKIPTFSANAAPKACELFASQHPDDPSAELTEWSMELGLLLTNESKRDVGATALAEVRYWADRLHTLAPCHKQLEEPAAQAVLKAAGAAESARWPVLHGQLLSAHHEAFRKCCDLSLFLKPLYTIENTLPKVSGIDSLWDACLPFHLAMCAVGLCGREVFEVGDLDRLYVKTNREVLVKLLEYIDAPSLFVVTDAEMNPPPRSALPPSDDPYEVTKIAPVVPACVVNGQNRLDKAAGLLEEWERLYTLCSGWMAARGPWPQDKRRIFIEFNTARERCGHLQAVLRDLQNELPDVVEDRGGYRRYQGLVALVRGIDFDVFDVGHKANWNAFMKRWGAAVEDKINTPDLSAAVELKPRITTKSIDERIPVTNVLAGFTPTLEMPKEFNLGKREGLTDAEKVTVLLQEKQVLAEELAKTNALLAADRHAMDKLLREYELSQQMVAALAAQLKEAKEQRAG
eukprot:TRINITY_DN16472_c0_g1_i1.p1 TRINITY_DN16472_c0_g1~~TRINITY_DN16472_c0_g1_i1.p1  ORF type:complete len:606 (+),score=230.33 TRINITY_DN16472_c0_g1_i1:64-1818(+)